MAGSNIIFIFSHTQHGKEENLTGMPVNNFWLLKSLWHSADTFITSKRRLFTFLKQSGILVFSKQYHPRGRLAFCQGVHSGFKQIQSKKKSAIVLTTIRLWGIFIGFQCSHKISEQILSFSQYIS